MAGDLSPTQALAVLLGAAIYATGEWVRHRMRHKAPNVAQAEAWAEGFRAGVVAATTGNPTTNPYQGYPSPLDVRQDT